MTIFLSYSREDVDRLGSLVEDLEQFGRPVWRDEKLSGGADWWRRILQQIRECETFLLAVSEASLTSEACTSETEYAHAEHRQIVPVRLEDVAVTLAPAPVAAILSQTHWIDYRSGQKQETIGLLRALSDRSPEELPDPLPPEPRVPGSYVTDLQTDVESPDGLEVRDQMALFFRVKELGETKRDRAAAIQLLQRLRRRHDLRTRVSDQIDGLSNTVRLDGEVVASEWRMAGSSPWDYAFEITDGTEAHPATLSVRIKEGFVDRIDGFCLVVSERTVYSENWS